MLSTADKGVDGMLSAAEKGVGDIPGTLSTADKRQLNG